MGRIFGALLTAVVLSCAHGERIRAAHLQRVAKINAAHDRQAQASRATWEPLIQQALLNLEQAKAGGDWQDVEHAQGLLVEAENWLESELLQNEARREEAIYYSQVQRDHDMQREAERRARAGAALSAAGRCDGSAQIAHCSRLRPAATGIRCVTARGRERQQSV